MVFSWPVLALWLLSALYHCCQGTFLPPKDYSRSSPNLLALQKLLEVKLQLPLSTQASALLEKVSETNDNYCRSGHLAVYMDSSNHRSLVTPDGHLSHASVQCSGEVPTECGNLSSPEANCSAKNCPCKFDEKSMLWELQHALATLVLARCGNETAGTKNRSTRVLNIGLGSGALPMHILQECPAAQLESVEIDPIVADLARSFFGFTEGSSNKLEMADGLESVKRRASAGERFDALVVDCFSEHGVPPPCKEDGFVTSLARLVNGTGLVVQHTWGGDKEEMLGKFGKHFDDVWIREGDDVETLIVANPDNSTRSALSLAQRQATT